MLRFIEETHQYFDGEIELPSVTDIVRFCNYDKKNENGNNPFYRDRGTAIHSLCADYDFTGELPQGTGYDGYLQAYADFLRDYRILGWSHVETPLGSAEQGYAGTVDRIGIIDDRVSILDIKTGGNVNEIALQAQLTGYQLLLSMPSAKLYGLQLRKNGEYKLIPVSPDYTLFNSCRYLHSKFWKGAKQ